MQKTIDWICIGSAKCGTTAFHQIIKQHPKIDGSTKKELHYWHSPNPGNLGNYHRNFPKFDNPNLLSGETTPGYVYFIDAMPRIQKYNPDIKLIWMIRNPLEMAVSAYFYTSRHQKQPFDAMLGVSAKFAKHRGDRGVDARRQVIARCQFGIQMERLLKLFKREQIHIIKNEDLRHNTQQTMNGVCEFLNIPHHKFQNATPNQGPKKDKTGIYGPNTKRTCNEIFLPDLEKFERLSGVSCLEWKKLLTSV